ncbi:hypothetical protein [Brevundimonas sp.]|uniref:hypothetical protein n=1 Tax=Brevundimonas sp. TaxID=1871086 RepID=UPI0028A26D3E|nr:hypothetical protein [Brevundimonas sp.]
MIRYVALFISGTLIALVVRELAPRHWSMRRLWLVQTALIVGVAVLAVCMGTL